MNYRKAFSCVAILVLGAIAAGCAKPEDASQQAKALAAEPGAASVPASQAGAPTGALNIVFASDPDPVRSGDNTLTVTVKQPDGTAVNDAAVSARFYMPAMPSMNMPEMRSDFVFAPQGDGLYKASGQLVMSGTWNVTVNVQPKEGVPETRTFSVIAN